MTPARTLPDCWGHRGASSRFPENTIASFEAAIRDGAEGIESDVHVSLDNVVVMFHDPDLKRTTNSTGNIREREWHGPDGIQHVRTTKEPHQAIPTFAETIALLMRPENQHANFNVDVKVQNTPARLFALMHETISSHPNWETLLAPRILLGLWHPSFLGPAKEQLPYCRRSYIGNSPAIARKYFWNDCEVFSVSFAALTSGDGQRFRQECKAGGKKVMVWTVNDPDHMMEAVRWEVDVILTDVTKTWLDLRTALRSDYEKIAAGYSRFFLWTSFRFYAPLRFIRAVVNRENLESVAGPFDKLKISSTQVALAYMMAWWLGVKL
ncbi:PLC-like phosphodiesterase [Mycena olivaceomarginata]|uniref:PLC-like phosphodiesterase n=1 Tax=Mycena albidolilacea TaxID=1033008 RepID=A0AAD7AVP4_9AGAR|nr:PLC-like phosphodiesterase [Mycena albidolilacea]KAJ7887573.1 PLC-like phosphodiesterase [Mycena olivaceomarginata]